ncbi:hypothetical protein CLV96_0153 [Leptospira meyeri]|uniref:Glycosyl transferase n=1 Tax=Leptospira meyeri TaxID=29508 RepID=A0A4R8MT25_LEPME|nr:hypothetical protein [Leptospira meyeri]TDY71198.1 hypothetical protein CLV96_0153 [Leptospira meyeri]
MSINYYCTLFDSNYLLRGVSMLQSLAEKDPSAKVFVFPFDNECYGSLQKLNLDFVQLISLAEFESPELLRVKNERTKGEYCWTCTPWIIRFCIDQFRLEHCTYVDADLFFFSNPQVLLDEAKNSSVLITEHRYSPEYDQSATAGIYCVQFVFFRNDADGIRILHWWADRCLEWCYSRFEDGKFGDQKYLDHWATEFNRVHILKHLGGGVAPWNVQQYEFVSDNHEIILKEKRSIQLFSVIFYHFHDVKIVENRLRFFSNFYTIHEDIYSSIYNKYSEFLNKNFHQLQTRQIQSETVNPILKDLANSLNNYKAIKSGSISETYIYITRNGDESLQTMHKFHFPCSTEFQDFSFSVSLNEYSKDGKNISGITIVPSRGNSIEFFLQSVFIIGLSSNNEKVEFYLDERKIKKLTKGNWQKRKGSLFSFYSANGFLNLPVSLRAIMNIQFNGRWRLISQIESAIEISKLSFSKRILKRLGL